MIHWLPLRHAPVADAGARGRGTLRPNTEVTHKASAIPPVANQRIDSFEIVEELGATLSTPFGPGRSTFRRSSR